MPDEFEGNEEYENEDAEHINEDGEIQSAEEFFEKFGFTHDCHCAEDWATGNLGVVAICYLNMCKEALEQLETIRTELVAAQDELAELRILEAEDE